MAKLIIGLGIPTEPQDERDDFHKIQDEIEHARWTGRGPHYVVGGGGNTLEEHDPEVNPEHEWR